MSPRQLWSGFHVLGLLLGEWQVLYRCDDSRFKLQGLSAHREWLVARCPVLSFIAWQTSGYVVR